jgi:predicted dehydrogenase
MQKEMRVAIIGAGEWAQLYHLPALKALETEIPLRIIGIWNRSPEKSWEAARCFGIPRIYGSLAEAVEDKEADCHVVLVNSSALFDIVSALAGNRRPVFTEKPPGKSYGEACRLAELVDFTNTVAFNRRFMPICREFKRQAGALRGPYFVECHFHRHGRQPERFIMETGIHAINFLEYLCGSIRSSKTERLGSAREGSSFWISRLSFENGTEGIMKLLPSSGASIERYELHGREESIFLNCPQTYTSDRPGRILLHRRGEQVAILDDREGGALLSAGFLDAYRDFFRACREGGESLSNFRNAANSLRVAESIQAAEAVFDGTCR